MLNNTELTTVIIRDYSNRKKLNANNYLREFFHIKLNYLLTRVNGLQ